MTLTELTRNVGVLRDLPAPERRAAVAELLPDLAEVAEDDRVNRDSRVNLITRALRAVSPRAVRPSTPEEALTALRTALDANRGPGRPPKGEPRTIRPSAETWQRVEECAERWGVSESDAAVRLIEQALGV